jgi:hypothetical protein
MRTIISAAVTAVFAFAIGGAAVWGYQSFAVSGRPRAVVAAPAPARGPIIEPSRDRIGRAATAPLLDICMRSGSPLAGVTIPDMAPSALYEMLRAATMQSHIKAVAGTTQEDAGAGVTSLLGPATDCVFTRQTEALCDPDNRALAIELITDFLHSVRRAEAELATLPLSKRYQFEQLSGLPARPRVLTALRDHLREGRLIADDFTQFAPAEVREAIADVKPVRNGCAGRGLGGPRGVSAASK